MYKEPDLYLSYGESTKSKYDLSDPATRFFYDLFEDYYLTFSQDVSQNKINNFVTQNSERLKLYKNYGGWKTIQSMMDLADPNDFKNVFNTVKKYSIQNSKRNSIKIVKQDIYYLKMNNLNNKKRCWKKLSPVIV